MIGTQGPTSVLTSSEELEEKVDAGGVVIEVNMPVGAM